MRRRLIVKSGRQTSQTKYKHMKERIDKILHKQNAIVSQDEEGPPLPFQPQSTPCLLSADSNVE